MYDIKDLVRSMWMKEKIIPKIDIKGNIIYGSINGYKFSGIVYRFNIKDVDLQLVY